MWPFRHNRATNESGENARDLQILFASQIVHSATIAALRVVENADTIVLDELTPSIAGQDFLEIIVFLVFVSTLGYGRGFPARNYILDSFFLLLGDLVFEVSDVETARQFERNRCSRMALYNMNYNRLFEGAQSVNRGSMMDGMIATLEGQVLKRRLHKLRPVLQEMILAHEIMAERYPAEGAQALQLDLGRNYDPSSIKAFRKHLAAVNAVSAEQEQITHIDQTKEILRIYLRPRVS